MMRFKSNKKLVVSDKRVRANITWCSGCSSDPGVG